MAKIEIPNCITTTAKLEDIIEGERFRKDYGDLTDLCHSIKTHGLINPITVIEDEGKYRLVAGGRRLAACKLAELAEAPIRIVTPDEGRGGLELTLRLIELAENLMRKEMTWLEQNALQREIHKLQQERFGTPAPGPSSSGWRIEDTASMLGVSKSEISASISLANKLDQYEDVLGSPEKFKTENEARKAVRFVEEALLRSELAARAEKKRGEGSFMQTIYDAYQIGDFVKGLALMPDGYFDFAEVDPPYGIDFENARRGYSYQGYEELKQEETCIKTREWMKLIYDKLAENAYCIYWFAPHPWFETIYRIAMETGFTGNRIPLVWIKSHGQSRVPDTNLASCYETAFIFRKGTPKLAKPGRVNIFDYKVVDPTNKFHPTQKPVELYEEIYKTFSFERAKCVAPFLGSGASILGGYIAGRQVIGWDLTEEFKGGFVQEAQKLFLK